MIPILYEKDEQNFQHGGLGQLPNLVDSYAREVGNAEYELYLEYPTVPEIDGYPNIIWEKLKAPERQILYKPSHSRAPHAFRIYDYEINSNSQTIIVYARTRANDLAKNVIRNVKATNVNPQAAMNMMKAGLEEPTDFDFWSNMDTTSSSSWEMQSALGAIMGEQGSIIQHWGGEVVRENRRISVYRRAGRENITTLRIGKNIEQLNYKLNTDNMTTAIIPYFKHRPEDSDNEVTIIGDAVKSEKFNNYRLPYYQFYQFDEEDGVTDEASLNRVAERWFNDRPGVDEPTLTINVDMTDVAESTEYEEILRKLEQVNVFDTVSVYVEEYGIDLIIKVNALTYDGFGERNLSVELGNATKGLFETFVNPQFDSVNKQLNEVRQIGVVAQISANGKSTNYHGDIDPNVAELVGSNGDIYFQQNGMHKRMWEWNAGQWELVLDTSELDGMKTEIGEIIEDAESDRQKVTEDIAAAISEAETYTNTQTQALNKELSDSIADATQTATDAVTRANTAIDEAGFARTDASTAINTANNAKTTADNANSTAAEAIGQAGTALSTAQNAISDASSAIGTAQDALDAVGGLEIGGRNLIISSNIEVANRHELIAPYIIEATGGGTSHFPAPAEPNTKYVMSAIFTGRVWVYLLENGAYRNVGSQSNNDSKKPIQYVFKFTTTDITEGIRFSFDTGNWQNKYPYSVSNWKLEKGNKKTDWTPAPEDVQVQITNINGELSRKVAQTSFDELNGTVTSQSTQISQNQKDIQLKSDTSIVDGINSTVTTQGLAITANYEALKLKAESSKVNTLEGTVSTHTNEIKANAQGLTMKAEASEVDTLAGTVEQHRMDIDANARAIDLRLTSTDVDNLVTQKGYATTSELTATSDSLGAMISSVETDLANLEIGGRNLLHSQLELVYGNDAIDGYGGRIITEIDGGYRLTDRFSAFGWKVMLEPNRKYTIHGKLDIQNSSTNNERLRFGLNSNRGSGVSGSTTIITDSRGRFSHTFTSRGDEFRDVIAFNLASGNSTTAVFELTELMLEKGTIVSDYQPPFEDMATRVQFNNIESTVNGTIQTISDIQKDLDSKASTQQFNEIESTVNGTTQTIASIQTALDGKASTQKVNEIVSTVEGTTQTIATIQTDLDGKATVLAFNELESTVNSNTSTIGDHTGNISSLQQTMGGLQTTVSNKANSSTVTQLATLVDTKVSNDDFESRITTMADNINLRVEGIEIGGRNLLHSQLPMVSGQNAANGYGATNYSKTENGYRIIGRWIAFGWEINLPPNTEFTISGEYRIWDTRDNARIDLSINNHSGSTVSNRRTMLLARGGTGRGNLKQTFTSNPEGGKNVIAFATNIDVSRQVIFDIEFIQLEKGKYATDYTPAPEDMAYADRLISQINLSPESILIQGEKILLDGNVTMTDAFVGQLKVVSLNAVLAEINTIRANVLGANVITSTHIQSSNALIDKLFSSSAYIDRLTSKAAFISDIKAIDISADRITTGILNAANVNIINLNVSSLVGNRSEFVRSAWNTALGGSTYIDGTEIKSTGADGEEISIGDGALNFYNRNGQHLMWMEPTYSSTYDGDIGFGINLRHNRQFSIIRRKTTASDEVIMRINPLDEHVTFLNDVTVGRLRIKGTNQYLLSRPQGGVSLIDSHAVRLGIGRPDSWVDVVTVNDNRNIDLYGRLRLNNNTIADASDLEINNHIYVRRSRGSSYYARMQYRNNNEFHIYASGGVRLGEVYNSEWRDLILAHNAGIHMYRSLNMNGNSITNQSDARLKEQITSTQTDSLSAIQKWEFVNYKWRDKSKPAGMQFGLIAQQTPELRTHDAEQDIYSIDSSRQLMMTTHAVQQLNQKVDTEVEKLKKEIAALKDKIVILEEKAA